MIIWAVAWWTTKVLVEHWVERKTNKQSPACVSSQFEIELHDSYPTYTILIL